MLKGERSEAKSWKKTFFSRPEALPQQDSEGRDKKIFFQLFASDKEGGFFKYGISHIP